MACRDDSTYKWLVVVYLEDRIMDMDDNTYQKAEIVGFFSPSLSSFPFRLVLDLRMSNSLSFTPQFPCSTLRVVH